MTIASKIEVLIMCYDMPSIPQFEAFIKFILEYDMALSSFECVNYVHSVNAISLGTCEKA